MSYLRGLWIVFLHLFRRTDTVEYPEEMLYLPPRYRGRIVLTRDPDGGERCVACYLCAVACPVDCIALQATEDETAAATRPGFASTSRAASTAASARRPARPTPSSSRPTPR